MSNRSNREQRHYPVMPDLPTDVYGEEVEIYPPVPVFPKYDYWDESNFEGDFTTDMTSPDLVIHDRYSELPGVRASDLLHEDRVADTGPQPRRKTEHERRHQARMTGTSEIIYDEAPSRPRRRRNRREPQDDVTGTSLSTSAIPADMVTGMRGTGRRTRARRRTNTGGNANWGWSRIVMPSFRQMLEQALPTLVMAISLLVAFVVIHRVPSLEGLWAPIVLIPSVVLFVLADKQIHPMWRRFALMNLGVVGVFYPLLVVRQSYLRIPYVEWGNGTLQMPMLSTFTIVVFLAVIALAAAWMSQDDPEYAGIMFLPAALLVPFFAGATEIVSLSTALVIAASVFFAASVLTVIASMLTGAYPMLIAPIALATEFLILPLSDSVPIFPLGAGLASKLLFFVILATTVGLTVAMPTLAAWVRQVRVIVHSADQGPVQAR